MKQVKTIIVVNDGNGDLRLIVSDGTLNEDGQNGIEFNIPFVGKDIGFSVGENLELKEVLPTYREN